MMLVERRTAVGVHFNPYNHHTLTENLWKTQQNPHNHRRRSGWNSGGRMARAEGGLVPSGVGYGEWCPIFSRLRVWGAS